MNTTDNCQKNIAIVSVTVHFVLVHITEVKHWHYETTNYCRI